MESLYQMGVCTWSPFTKWESAHGVPLPNGSVHMESLYQMGVCTWSTWLAAGHKATFPHDSILKTIIIVNFQLSFKYCWRRSLSVVTTGHIRQGGEEEVPAGGEEEEVSAGGGEEEEEEVPAGGGEEEVPAGGGEEEEVPAVGLEILILP